tara:strand:- start:4439 stop:4945 length:507 start_codon:yes stop_codon:yes gene_type:complete
MKTSTIIEESLVELETAYPQHVRFNPITDTFVEQWKSKLGHFPDESLKLAFNEHILLGDRFPTIADIRALSNKHSKELHKKRRRAEISLESDQRFDDVDNKKKVAKRSIETFNKLVRDFAENPKKEFKERKRPDSVTKSYVDGRPINTILRTDLRSKIQYEYIQFLDK